MNECVEAFTGLRWSSSVGSDCAAPSGSSPLTRLIWVDFWWPGSVPYDLVADFASSLAAPGPSPRRTLPQGAEARLTIVRRT
ncbi:hypothetical protein ACFRFL_25220 [Streptomyces sp. NPDC056708]|uniref:hypothetical protein n=1 Tax=unclassified Streptomyces TaxID=2593676 RepID=UPI0036B72FEA